MAGLMPAEDAITCGRKTCKIIRKMPMIWMACRRLSDAGPKVERLTRTAKTVGATTELQSPGRAYDRTAIHRALHRDVVKFARRFAISAAASPAAGSFQVCREADNMILHPALGTRFVTGQELGRGGQS
jgi:hypothetical protein